MLAHRKVKGQPAAAVMQIWRKSTKKVKRLNEWKAAFTVLWQVCSQHKFALHTRTNLEAAYCMFEI